MQPDFSCKCLYGHMLEHNHSQNVTDYLQKKSRLMHCFKCVQVFKINCTILYYRLTSLFLIEKFYAGSTYTWDLIYSWGKLIQDKKPISFLEWIHIITYIHHRERKLINFYSNGTKKKTIYVHLVITIHVTERSGVLSFIECDLFKYAFPYGSLYMVKNIFVWNQPSGCYFCRKREGSNCLSHTLIKYFHLRRWSHSSCKASDKTVKPWQIYRTFKFLLSESKWLIMHFNILKKPLWLLLKY